MLPVPWIIHWCIYEATHSTKQNFNLINLCNYGMHKMVDPVNIEPYEADNKFIVDCWPEFRHTKVCVTNAYLRLWFFTKMKMKILSLHLNWISRQVIWKGDAGKITINDTDYQLQQCHWHSPSEHTFNGSRFVCLPSLLLKFKNYTLMRTLPPTPLNTLQSSHMYI